MIGCLMLYMHNFLNNGSISCTPLSMWILHTSDFMSIFLFTLSTQIWLTCCFYNPFVVFLFSLLWYFKYSIHVLKCTQGIYLVSVTKSGCLTVHDFETLYCQIPELTCKFCFGGCVLLIFKMLLCLSNLGD